MKQVFFRVDASMGIGSGHVMRCLTLARALKFLGAKVEFFMAEGPGDFIKFVEQNGIIVNRLPLVLPPFSVDGVFAGQEAWLLDSESFKKASNGKKADWLVIDHYSLDEKWEAAVRSCFVNLLVIDDLANRRHTCNWLLDQNFSDPSRYSQMVPTRTLMFLGPANALLRDEFVEARKKSQKLRSEIKRVLVFFGAADITGETPKALEALLRLNFEVSAEVILGASNIQAEEIRAAFSSYPQFRFHKSVSYISEIIVQSDIAIGAAGTSSWERSYLGLPSLIIEVAENQKGLAKVLEGAGCAVDLGWHSGVTSMMISEHLMRIQQDPRILSQMSKSGYEIWSGNPDPAKQLAEKMLKC